MPEIKYSEMALGAALSGSEIWAMTQDGASVAVNVTMVRDFVSASIEALVQGFDPKIAVRARINSNVNIAGGAIANGTTHDDVTLATGNRVILTGQTAQAENGIYIVPASGAAARSTDMDSWAEVVGAYIPVQEGTTYANSILMAVVEASGTLDTTAIIFTQVQALANYVQGTGITISGNAISIDSAVVATLTGVQTLTNKTLTSPKITNALLASAWLRVNSDGTTILRTAAQTLSDLGAGDGRTLTIITPDTATTHLIKATDTEGIVLFNSGSLCTITGPSQATEENVVGLHVGVVNKGGGGVLFATEDDDTVDKVRLMQQPEVVSTIYLESISGDDNAWSIIGNEWYPTNVEDDALTAPPGSPPTIGSVFIPAATATDDWLGHEGEFAIYTGATYGYQYVTPKIGHVVFDKTSAAAIIRGNSAWVSL